MEGNIVLVDNGEFLNYQVGRHWPSRSVYLRNFSDAAHYANTTNQQISIVLTEFLDFLQDDVSLEDMVNVIRSAQHDIPIIGCTNMDYYPAVSIARRLELPVLVMKTATCERRLRGIVGIMLNKPSAYDRNSKPVVIENRMRI